MNISFWLNGVYRQEEIEPGMLLIDFLREKGCYSVKRGCETANCGLCTVLVEDRPILSCSTLAARIDGKKVVTMEGMQREAQEFGSFLANEGAEQCGFCNPGFIMNVICLCFMRSKSRRKNRLRNILPEICAVCSGFVSQTTSILKFLKYKKAQEDA